VRRRHNLVGRDRHARLGDLARHGCFDIVGDLGPVGDDVQLGIASGRGRDLVHEPDLLVGRRFE
jgi:hypothetical protein